MAAKEDGEYVTDDNGKKVNDNEKRHQYCPLTADTGEQPIRQKLIFQKQ